MYEHRNGNKGDITASGDLQFYRGIFDVLHRESLVSAYTANHTYWIWFWTVARFVI